MSKKIEVVLVDDHNLFREGIKSILSQTENLSIVGTASNGKELMDYLQKEKAPDIIFMDINMPVMYGVEACTLVSKNYPGIKVIVLSMNEEQEYYHKMIQAGAKGFVQKQAGREQLEEAIKEVLNGGSYFPADILRNIIFKFGTEDPEEKKIEKHYELTKREKEILALLCQGYTNTEIAEQLFLSIKTIEGYKSNLLSKTGTKNSAHLVIFAIKNGIIKI